MEISPPRYLIAGQLSREFTLLPSGETLLDVPGGNALYAAVGLAVWESQPPPGIVARVGEDYPAEWLETFAQHGLNIGGIRVQDQPVDVRSFSAFVDRTTLLKDDPVTHFARLGLPFPRALLGYKSNPSPMDSKTRLTPTSLRQGDIPADFLDASAAHLCPLDYLTHTVLPAVLRQAEFTTVTIAPSPGYMNSNFWSDIPALVTGLTAFMPTEAEIRSLFQGCSNDLWEMASALAAYGCETIVIRCGERGQLLYDSAARARWEIPPYPVRQVNPMGVGDAFCGGFLAGYRRNYDSLEAVLCGNISASLVAEGNTPYYALDALPGLPQARLEALRQSARRV